MKREAFLLTDRHIDALRKFDGAEAGTEEIESIDEDAGRECIRMGLVELSGPLLAPRLRFALTEAGRSILSGARE